MANTGLGSQLGLKKETTWGTAVTVDKFFKYESESFALDQTTSTRSALQAGITFGPQSLTKGTTRTAGGDFSMYVPYRLTGHLFDQMVAGTITPVQQARRSRTCRRSTWARPRRRRARRSRSTSRRRARVTWRTRTRAVS
jgi:hypothetical protein